LDFAFLHRYCTKSRRWKCPPAIGDLAESAPIPPILEEVVEHVGALIHCPAGERGGRSEGCALSIMVTIRWKLVHDFQKE